jgi:hypothetical protein
MKQYKNIVLIQNEPITHYRVSIYNYLYLHFLDFGWKLYVVSETIEKNNPHEIHFIWMKMKINFFGVLVRVRRIKPSVIIAFLGLKHPIIWGLLLFDKLRISPVITWRHAIDLQQPNHFIKNWLYSRIDYFASAILLYANNELKYIADKHRSKIYIANNTINFGDFPEIQESKAELREK